MTVPDLSRRATATAPARTITASVRIARWSVAAVGFVGLAALAGCGVRGSGSPVDGSGMGPVTSVSAMDPTGSVVSSASRVWPHRPRTLDLAGVDPCVDVLTPDQLRQLAYDLGYQRAPRPGTDDIDHGPTCTYSSSRAPDQPSRNIGSLVIISTAAGAQIWLTDPARSSSAALARPTTIAGFPALVVPHPHPRFVDNCSVVLDVADGQYLAISSTSSGGGKGTSPDPYCAEAQRVAEMAIHTLSSRR